MADFANLMGLIFGDKEIDKNKKEMLDRQALVDEKAKLAADQAYKQEALQRAHPTLPEEGQQLQEVSKMGGSALENLLRLRGRDTDAEMQADIANKYANINNQADDNNIKRQDLDLRRQVLAQGLQEKQDKASRGHILPAAEAAKLAEGNNIPGMLDNLERTLKSNADVGGPVVGRLSSINPYATKTQNVQAQIDSTKQLVGKFLEGGVLRKEDEEKYNKILPTLTDTIDVRNEKLKILRGMIQAKQNEYLDSYDKSGYDVSQFSKLGQPQQSKRSRQPNSVNPAVQPAVGGNVRDSIAVRWAKANLNDPTKAQKAQAILEANGVK